MKKNRLLVIISTFLAIMSIAAFTLGLVACNGDNKDDGGDSDRVTAIIESINELPESVSLSDEAEIEKIQKAYDKLTESDKAKVTNYNTLKNLKTVLADLKAIDALEFTFLSEGSVQANEVYTPEIDASGLTFKNIVPTVTYTLLAGNTAKAKMNADYTVVAENPGKFTVQAHVRYQGYNIEKTLDKEVEVKGLPVSVTVTLPEANANLISKVRLSTKDGIMFDYNALTGKYEASLPDGSVELTCSLDGFESESKTVTVARDAANEFKIGIGGYKFGPAVKIGAGNSGAWSNNDGIAVVEKSENKEDTSFYALASGNTATTLMISADITMEVGLFHDSPDEGAGLMIANCTGIGGFGVIMKPGQKLFCLTDNALQNLAAWAGDGIDAGITKDCVSFYEGTRPNGKGRVLCENEFPAGGSKYTLTKNLKLVRLNSYVFVFVDGTLYADFRIPAIENVAGSFGFINMNHDKVTYSNIKFVTDEKLIYKEFGDNLVDVTVAEGKDKVNVTLEGDIGGKALKGKTVSITVAPKTAKVFASKLNDTTFKGVRNADGSVTYTGTVSKSLEIYAKTLNKQALLDANDVKVTVTAAEEVRADDINWAEANISMTDSEGYNYFLTYAGEGVFEGKLPFDYYYISGSYLRYADKSTEDFALNETDLSFEFDEYAYGPVDEFQGSGVSWSYDSKTKSVSMTKTNNPEEASRYAVANGFKSKTIMVSAKITMEVGSFHTSPDEGSGIEFTYGTDTNCGILIKPGQGLFCFTWFNGWVVQNLAAYGAPANNSVDLGITKSGINVFNGATVKENNGRIITPALRDYTGKSSYKATVDLTVIRRNTEVYVLINDTLYLAITVPGLNDVEGGIAFYNVNHDKIKYENISFTTEVQEKLCTLGYHAWDEGVVTLEPTVDTEGVKTFTCTECGETKTEKLNKLPMAAENITVEFGYESAYVLDANGEKVYLYDLSGINASDVEVSLYNVYTEKATKFNLKSAKDAHEIVTAEYIVTYTYKGAVWSETLAIRKGTTEYTGCVSLASLGGSVTFTKYDGTENFELKSFGSNWKYSDNEANSVNMTGYTYSMQNTVVADKIYAEGIFDLNKQSYASEIGSSSAGILIAHGPDELSGNNNQQSYKLVIGLRGTSVIATRLGTAWDSHDSAIVANFDYMNIKDMSNVKLGVLRDGTTYYCYVNGVYVGKYVYSAITNASGIGVAAAGTVDVTVKKFNYSVRTEVINALKVTEAVKDIDIYLIAGQSNASGCTNASPAELLGLGNTKYVYGFENVYYVGNAGANWMNKVSVGLARGGLGETTVRIGGELGLAEGLSKYYNKESGKYAGMIKYAVGGTSLLDDLSGYNGSDGNWVSPSYQKTLSSVAGGLTGGLYRNFLIEFKEAWQMYKDMGFNPVIKGFYWMQGESNRGYEDEYKKAFKYFVNDMKADLTKITGQDQSELPFIIGLICETEENAYANTVAMNKTFIRMQRELAEEIPNCYVNESSGYATNALNSSGTSYATGSDSWHWKYTDHIEIGKKLADVIFKNILRVTV